MHQQLHCDGLALPWTARLQHLDLHKQGAWVSRVLTAGPLQTGMLCLCCGVCFVRAMHCELLQVDWTDVPTDKWAGS